MTRKMSEEGAGSRMSQPMTICETHNDESTQVGRIINVGTTSQNLETQQTVRFVQEEEEEDLNEFSLADIDSGFDVILGEQNVDNPIAEQLEGHHGNNIKKKQGRNRGRKKNSKNVVRREKKKKLLKS